MHSERALVDGERPDAQVVHLSDAVDAHQSALDVIEVEARRQAWHVIIITIVRVQLYGVRTLSIILTYMHMYVSHTYLPHELQAYLVFTFHKNVKRVSQNRQCRYDD